MKIDLSQYNYRENRSKFAPFKDTTSLGFTIVELLVVIVVIAILAAITIISYTGVTSRAISAALQSDLTTASQQLKLYSAEHGSYPTSIDNATKCLKDSSGTVDTNYCLKASNGNSYNTYTYNNSVTFSLTATNTNGTAYTVTDNSSPKLATLDPANWLTVGTQVWAKTNLNVGNMVTGATTQTNNSVLEKYCYNDTASNCDTSGGLYQWDEAMQYTNAAGAQGICPTGSHIPTDNDWKILEIQLGMTQAQADLSSAWRGTDQGTQLKAGGSSGLNVLLAGIRITDGSFNYLSSLGYLWSSSESSTTYAWDRYFSSSNTSVYRQANVKGYGFSVRCIGN